MALVIRGAQNGLTLQSASEIVQDFDGTLRGTATFEGDASYASRVPQLGDLHPKDSRLICISPSITWMEAGKIRAKADYLGIASDPTPGIIDHPGGTSQDPIETHPKFVSAIAGTPGNPRNGAIFDEETEEFIAFGPGPFAGVRSYLNPSMSVSVSWWTRRVPQLGLVGKRLSGGLSNFNPPPNCRDMLLTGMPYRQYGGTNGAPAVFFVTAQILCAPNWNSTIY